MRLAKASDYRRAADKKKFKRFLKSAAYANIRKLGTNKIEFRSGITAITGLNGAGKSSILDIIKFASCNTLSQSSLYVDERSACNLEWAEEEEIPVYYLDPAAEADALRAGIFSQENLYDLIEPLSPYKLKQDEIEELNYLIGRQYEYCHIYEIDEYDTVVPFFRVKSCDTEYDSTSMGHGELSLHILYWYVKNMQEGSVFLIDEPENRVSTRSQRAIVDYLSKYCAKKSIWVILSTLSSTILSRVPYKNIRILSRNTDNVYIHNEIENKDLEALLEITSQYKGIFLVEDNAAVLF